MKKITILTAALISAGCAQVRIYNNPEKVSDFGLTTVISDYQSACHVNITGSIGLDSWQFSSKLFESIEQRNCKITYITLNIDGGDINSAIRIGTSFRVRGYNTVLTKETKCTSACSLIFLSGNKRYIANSDEVVLGVHRIKDSRSNTCYDFSGYQAIANDSMRAIDNFKKYSIRMLGVASGENFIRFAQSAHCNDMRYLNSHELISSGISNGYYKFE